MIGTELVPLNQMHGVMTKIRDTYQQKYNGREEIMQRKVPLLDCLWNDVVQFLPLHPSRVFELQKRMRLIPSIPHYRFYELDIDSLDSDRAVVFFKNAVGEENTEVKWLKDVDISELQEIPSATRKYYETLIDTGTAPFNYQFIPHILYRGTVNISASKIIAL